MLILLGAGFAEYSFAQQPTPIVQKGGATSPGMEHYVLVKKLIRLGGQSKTAFRAVQWETLNDLLEPLFEQPETDAEKVKICISSVRSKLFTNQTAALDAINDITPESVVPPNPVGFLDELFPGTTAPAPREPFPRPLVPYALRVYAENVAKPRFYRFKCKQRK